MLGIQEAVSDAAVIREDDEPVGILVESPDREGAPKLFEFRRFHPNIALAALWRMRDDSLRCVVCKIHTLFFRASGFLYFDFVPLVYFVAEHGKAAVCENFIARNKLVG